VNTGSITPNKVLTPLSTTDSTVTAQIEHLTGYLIGGT
jgi:hypothetical protein